MDLPTSLVHPYQQCIPDYHRAVDDAPLPVQGSVNERGLPVFLFIFFSETRETVVLVVIEGVDSSLWLSQQSSCMTDGSEIYRLQIFRDIGMLGSVRAILFPQFSQRDLCPRNSQGGFKASNKLIDKTSLRVVGGWKVVRRIEKLDRRLEDYEPEKERDRGTKWGANLRRTAEHGRVSIPYRNKL